MPRISGSFDCCFGGRLETSGNGALGADGNGALCGGGNGALGAGGFCGTAADGGGLCGCCCWCKFAEVDEPVGPVFFGRTAVGADDEVATVALKSGCGVLVGLSLGGSAGVVPRFGETA